MFKNKLWMIEIDYKNVLVKHVVRKRKKIINYQ